MYFSAKSLQELKQLEHLHVENYRGESLMFVKCENLKILETNYLYPFGLDFMWSNFTKNNPNLNKIIIREIGNFKLVESIKREVAIIVRSLSNLNNLEYFEVVHTPQSPIVNADANEREPRREVLQAFFKIVVNNGDTKSKTIKVSDYVRNYCEEEMTFLKTKFDKCEVLSLNS